MARILPTIPVIETGPDFPLATLVAEEARAHMLIAAATQRVPRAVLRTLDAISKAWLAKGDPAHFAEVEAVSQRLGRPGAYFLAVNYEWACTCRVAPAPDGDAARLIRVLDWRTPGLGRNLVAAHVAGSAGPYTTLTWPGYTGVLQAVAPGRFAIALNQAPMRSPVGVFLLDWVANRRRVWRSPQETSSHLLRRVFETAATFAEAREMLSAAPISAPALYSIAGTTPDALAVVERMEHRAKVHDGARAVANHWSSPGWAGHHRGKDSRGRAEMMNAIEPALDPAFRWLAPPILNPRTRLALVAEAATGRFVVAGFEDGRQATQTFECPATRPEPAAADDTATGARAQGDGVRDPAHNST